MNGYYELGFILMFLLFINFIFANNNLNTNKMDIKNIEVATSNSKNTIKVNFNDARKASLILRSLNHKLRQDILRLLDENKKLSVTDIFVKLRIEQSVASQHLSILRKANILETVRVGKFIYYQICYSRVEEINSFIKSLLS
jgi:DNA-binding transcriptional ArsR family regulator